MKYRQFNGRDAASYFDELSDLRMQVFLEFPYLYDGDKDYEKQYLEAYFQCPHSIVVIAFDGKKIVGAATGLPLEQAAPEMQAVFSRRSIDTSAVYYFGESMLLPAYRSRGIGHKFFDLRESYARSLAPIKMMAFAAVKRDEHDKRRPANHRRLDDFWTRRGYYKMADLTTTFSWKEVGEDTASPKTMEFWINLKVD